MSDIEHRLAEDRTIRNSARGVFDAGVGTVKADLAARGIGGRIVATATGKVRDVGNEALAVARESKGIIAGTIAALGLWTIRKPLIAAAHKFFGDQASVQADLLEDGETSGEPASD